MTVSQLMELWLEQQQNKLKDTSFASYRQIIEKHIIPVLGDYDLTKINRSTLQTFIDQLRTNQITDKGIQTINSKINAALCWAVEQGYIEHAGFCIRFKTDSTICRSKTLESWEQEKLISYLFLQNTTVHFGVLLCLELGINIGELCAIQWDDFDFKDRKLRISKQLQRIPRKTTDETSKTTLKVLTQEIRYIELPVDIYYSIKELYQASKYYFLTNKDRPMEPRVLQSRFKTILRAAGLDEAVNFQILHATFLTESLKKGYSLPHISNMAGAKNQGYVWERYGNPI